MSPKKSFPRFGSKLRIFLTLSRFRGTLLGTLARNFEISANRKVEIGKQKLVAGTLTFQTLADDFFSLINKLISE